MSSPTSPSPVSAATAWRNCSASASSQRPYGSGSCGGSAANMGIGRSDGGTKSRTLLTGLAQLLRWPLRRQDGEMHAGPDLEPGQVGEPGKDVDPPAEALGALRRGADPHVERRRRTEHRAEPGEHRLQHRRAGGAVVLEPGRRAAGDELDLEGDGGGEGGDGHHLVVHGYQALATANLLLNEV